MLPAAPTLTLPLMEPPMPPTPLPPPQNRLGRRRGLSVSALKPCLNDSPRFASPLRCLFVFLSL